MNGATRRSRNYLNGVEAIAVRATASYGYPPMNSQGLRLKDGRTLPAWDWVATPLR